MAIDTIHAIYKILRALEISMDYEEFNDAMISAKRLGISEAKRANLLRMLLLDGLIEGIGMESDAAGNLYESKGRPRITLKGLEYMRENSLMQRAARAMKGVRDMV